MRSAITAAFTWCLALSSVVFAAEKSSSTSRIDELLKWNGTWVQSEGMNRALGFTDKDSREDSLLGDLHPTSFELQLFKTIGEGVSPEILGAYRDGVFKRMGHRIIATGQWKLTFPEENRLILSDCFVTEHEGSTFLWVPANWVVIFGGKLSLIQGRDRTHDAIIVDLKASPDEERSLDTVAFQRKPSAIPKQD